MKAFRTFVGFYWTLPVPRMGFTRLPASVEEAAVASRTIRYQRELVSRHAAACAGTVVDEVVWLELEPDRGGADVGDAIKQAFDRCRRTGAQLLYVEFGQRYGWRKHMHLRELLLHAPVPCRGLDPVAIQIDGVEFDPIEHFRQWQRKLEDLRTSQEHRSGLRQAILELVDPYLPPELHRPDYQGAAEFLNREGMKTVTGKLWHADNLRMFLKPAGDLPPG